MRCNSQRSAVPVLLALALWLPAPRAAPRPIHVGILGTTQSIVVKARLAPDAERTSLHVTQLRFVARSDGMLVHFTVVRGDVVTLQKVAVVRPLLRDRKIASRDGGVRHAPVVALDLCIGGRRLVNVPVTLLRRHSYTAAMTLGRAQIAELPPSASSGADLSACIAQQDAAGQPH